MMDVRAYIESGILEMYCLGLLTDLERAEAARICDLYPEIKDEMNSIVTALEVYALENTADSIVEMEESIRDIIFNLEKERAMDPEDLPLINRFSDHSNWLKLVKPDVPEQLEGERICKVLRFTKDMAQMLIVSNTDFEDEVHEELYESFLILEGSCECTVGDKTFCLHPGDFTSIPLDTAHQVRVLTPHITAILQRVAV